ncbi:putative periplasmic serine endoprotease DegP-like precursor [Rubripirellula amarantea]|uniref:Putative periplasmic serine endoprotease DegP-like n=1 Tax=Rubripirellula amarantea TaxID=2527999 RepID=A0A5C5WSV2_9BACT|nr:trypsin-like peptidase domain-containing protein [Rubripirellula amarantea]TWT53153.1 putative periplasmic serine endoprotease DegP-like precursor [Rubripirellula amarantea]
MREDPTSGEELRLGNRPTWDSKSGSGDVPPQAGNDRQVPGVYQISLHRIDPATGQPIQTPHVEQTATTLPSGSLTSPPEVLQPRSIPIPVVSKPVRPQAPSTSSVHTRRTDPILQSVGMLATMAVMLLAARFVVPHIVEEIRYGWHRGELRAEYEAGTDGLRNVSLESLSDAYEMVTAAVGPSVVHIDVQRRLPMTQLDMDASIANRLLPSSDQGSGVVVDSDGYMVTNRHVISEGEDITVTLSDGRRLPAVVVGTDSLTDLAVLKVDASGLIPILWGDSDRCRVGSPVWAVGSPFGLDRTVTFGILSGKHRKVRASTEWQDFMQSDVAVNPGNSGGPLVDARGTLIGINTAIVGDTYQGVSFSVPSNVARKVYERIKTNGRVDRGWLGVSLGKVSDDLLVGNDPRMRGAAVQYLPDDKAPAARAGIQVGDIIIEVDQTPVRETSHLMQMIGQSGPGEKIELRIWRDGKMMNVPIVLDARPDSLNLR